MYVHMTLLRRRILKVVMAVYARARALALLFVLWRVWFIHKLFLPLIRARDANMWGQYPQGGRLYTSSSQGLSVRSSYTETNS